MSIEFKPLTATQRNFVECAAEFGCTSPISRADVLEVISEYDMPIPQWLVGPIGKLRRAGRGLYLLPELSEFNGQSNSVGESTIPVSVATTENVVATAPAQMSHDAQAVATFALAPDAGLIPDRNALYVPFGHHKDLEKILKSKIFYPCFVTGLSGNGKTTMIEQICAKAKREMFRVNITIETDEDDLLGGFRLINGDMVWCDGPVVQAMKKGAILLLDEIDLASVKCMCLQPVLEGKGVFVKKISKWVTPAKGFQIFATANTKGKGDDAGKFIGTNVLNEAFLDRFKSTWDQEYPSRGQETKILNNQMKFAELEDKEFVGNLVRWAEIVRKSYYEDAVDEIITTRRLVNIIEAFAIFGDKKKAIDISISRFDNDTKEAFESLYSKIDADIDDDEEKDAESAKSTTTGNECPF